MSDFSELLASMGGPEDPDPKVQKERELNRLYTLANAAATQALWNASKVRVIFSIVGFVFLPPVAFWAATLPFSDSQQPLLFGLAGLLAWALAAVLVFFAARFLGEADAEHELEKTMRPLLQADDAFRKKWGEPRRRPTSKAQD